MSKIKYSAREIEVLSMNEEGKKYLEYNDRVGGEPIGLIIPFGYPYGVAEMGGIIAVYDECIKQGITWEKLLNWAPPEDVVF